MNLRTAVLVGFALWSASATASAADVPGSKDDPLIGRFQGSTITYYRHADFDEAALLQAPSNYAALLNANTLNDRSRPEWLQTEGSLTQIRYEIPTGSSSLAVFRSYQQSLTAAGFTTVFTCIDQACFSGNVNDPYLLGQQIDTTNGISTAYFDHARYALFGRGDVTGMVYVAILAGDDKDQATAFVEDVQPKPLAPGKIVTPDASSLQTTIQAAGKVDVYGILFDFDKDVVKPDSKPTLDAIGALLAGNPKLALNIVGHTDNVGSDAYNLDLSQRRAASVVAALVRDYHVDPQRLTAVGDGAGHPVAANDTEDGRAKNRRVELQQR